MVLLSTPNTIIRPRQLIDSRPCAAIVPAAGRNDNIVIFDIIFSRACQLIYYTRLSGSVYRRQVFASRTRREISALVIYSH